LGERPPCKREARGSNPLISTCPRSECGAAWLARMLWEHEAAGSNPAIPTKSAGHRVVLCDQGAFQDRLTVI
jgi:hypothetical protein